jgi:hypothetical protein
MLVLGLAKIAASVLLSALHIFSTRLTSSALSIFWRYLLIVTLWNSSLFGLKSITLVSAYIARFRTMLLGADEGLVSSVVF